MLREMRPIDYQFNTNNWHISGIWLQERDPLVDKSKQTTKMSVTLQMTDISVEWWLLEIRRCNNRHCKVVIRAIIIWPVITRTRCNGVMFMNRRLLIYRQFQEEDLLVHYIENYLLKLVATLMSQVKRQFKRCLDPSFCVNIIRFPMWSCCR